VKTRNKFAMLELFASVTSQFSRMNPRRIMNLKEAASEQFSHAR
jgi:hypothetical protein